MADEKIIRVTFTAFDLTFFLDRSYDNTISNEENCDNALTFVIQSAEDKKAIPVMHQRVIEGKEGPTFDNKPSVLNFTQVPYVTIINVEIYKIEKK
jgi:hypothetical protein